MSTFDVTFPPTFQVWLGFHHHIRQLYFQTLAVLNSSSGRILRLNLSKALEPKASKNHFQNATAAKR